MNASFFHGFQGLDVVHLIAFGVIAVTVAVILLIAFRSPATATLLSLMSGKYFKMSNGNGNGGLAHSQSVEKALAKHEVTCNDRHAKIDDKFATVFSKLDNLTSAVSEIKGYLKGKSEVK